MGQEVLEIFGTKGKLKIDRYQNTKAEIDLKSALTNRKVRVFRQFIKNWNFLKLMKYIFYKNLIWTYVEELQYFIDCIKKDKAPVPSIEDGVKSLEVVLAAYESVTKNTPVDILG